MYSDLLNKTDMMKRFTTVLLAVVVTLLLCSCSGGTEEETTVVNETVSTAEETTKRTPAIYEMSPESTDVTLTAEIARNTSQLDFSSFTEISAGDSYLKITQSDKILKNEKAEYYFLGSENKILVVLFGEDGYPAYSASYNSENGALQFVGDDVRTWYFNDDGALNCMVYEYNDDSGLSGIYTFYTPEGSRDLVRVGSIYYDSELFELTDNESISYIQKYSHTMEIVSQ